MRAEKAPSRNAAMNGCGKSEKAVVPGKPSNDGPPSLAESEETVEGRAFAKRNPNQRSTSRTLSRNHGVSPELERVRERAKREKGAVFSALFHHIGVDRLRDSYGNLKPKAAAGVDGVRWQDYGRELEANLHDLCGRLHRGAYRAKPSRRVYIPKADGRERPLGIAALLDEQFSVIEENEREIDAALKRSVALRQSILKKAFTGQLVPQDSSDEPASVLLERIRAERGKANPAPKSKRARSSI